jgi:hypothetical protein
MRGGVRTGAGRKAGIPNKVQKEKSVTYQIRVDAKMKAALIAIGPKAVKACLAELIKTTRRD